jgi:hypothetical protein
MSACQGPERCALRSDRPKHPGSHVAVQRESVCLLPSTRKRLLLPIASVCRTDARKTAPRPSLMTLFKLPSQGRAVELRAAQQMLMQFARLKSSQPIEEFGTSVIDRPTLARHDQCVLVRESQVRRSIAAGKVRLWRTANSARGAARRWLCTGRSPPGGPIRVQAGGTTALLPEPPIPGGAGLQRSGCLRVVWASLGRVGRRDTPAETPRPGQ